MRASRFDVGWTSGWVDSVDVIGGQFATSNLGVNVVWPIGLVEMWLDWALAPRTDSGLHLTEA